MGAIWEVSLGDFLLVTVFLGGGAAYMTGRAVAETWRALPLLIVYVVLLTFAVRFIHHALFGGEILAAQFFVVDLVVVSIFAALGFRITRAAQMAGQYSWLYERTGPLSWRERAKG
jgi:hypothetical protein